MLSPRSSAPPPPSPYRGNAPASAGAKARLADGLLHPESFNTFDSLAEAYEVNKDNELAIKAYQHVLALDPKNDNATQRLKILGRTGGNGTLK